LAGQAVYAIGSQVDYMDEVQFGVKTTRESHRLVRRSDRLFRKIHRQHNLRQRKHRNLHRSLKQHLGQVGNAANTEDNLVHERVISRSWVICPVRGGVPAYTRVIRLKSIPVYTTHPTKHTAIARDVLR